MDDKTFMAKYVADESTRIKDRLKKMVESSTPPTEEEKQSIMVDMTETLDRLKKSLMQIEAMMEKEDDESTPQ
jgi:uncharacterized protein YukE